MNFGCGEEPPFVQRDHHPCGRARPGFVVARHSAEEWTAARHPHELPRSHGVHLYLDLAQHGLGSRSCGPDVRPEHALWPRPVSASVLFRVGRPPGRTAVPTATVANDHGSD